RHGLHRHRSDAAHRLVQDDAAEDLDARDHLRDQIGPRTRLRVMFLQHDSSHAVDARDLGGFDRVECTLEVQHRRLRRRVRVDVDDAGEARCIINLCDAHAGYAERPCQNNPEDPVSQSHRSLPSRTSGYRAGTAGDACEWSDGTNLSYRVRAKTMARIAARIATAA